MLSYVTPFFPPPFPSPHPPFRSARSLSLYARLTPLPAPSSWADCLWYSGAVPASDYPADLANGTDRSVALEYPGVADLTASGWDRGVPGAFCFRYDSAGNPPTRV